MRYSLSLPQGWVMDLAHIKAPVEAYEAMTGVARTADEVGFECVYLVDHFHTIPQPSQEVTFECWTTTAALARDTQRVRVGQLVTCNSYRNPALLAKMASTVDVLSHGRLNFGIGAGWYEHEYRAYGYEFPDAPERLRQLREAVQVIRAMWETPEASFEGRYYTVKGAINSPRGVQKRIPMMIGGGGEKVTLKLVAQYGDSCNVNGDLETIRHKLAVLDQHCADLGRDPKSVARTVTCLCSIGDSEEDARSKVPPAILQMGWAGGAALGDAAGLRERFRQFEELGVDEVILAFPDALKLDPLKRFADAFL